MICSNPDCQFAGKDQSPENFFNGKRQCKSCISKIRRTWYEKNRDSLLLSYKRIPDDDPETDLIPDSAGEASWARLTR